MTEAFRLTFARTGGVTGRRVGAEVTSERLEPGERVRAARLIDGAAFFELEREYRAPGPAADRFQYTVTLTRGGRSHTVTAHEAAVPAPLRPLLDWLRTRAEG